ncbi:Brp/Blh family beta-carotene 15,15'-dioxygenase [Nocardioidaceae bacterium]|nr:Brp/Blh family beta-carotene 15,15'-dioxygenase [Nocardioidaceae bacterium]
MTWLSRAAVGATALAAALSHLFLDGGTAGWAPLELPLVLLALLVTLPHGAADAAAPYLRSLRLTWGTYAGLGLAYATLAALIWTVSRSVPLLGLTLLVVLSVAHFGAGEVTFHRETGAPLPRAWGASAGLISGLVVVVLPLVAHPGQSASWILQVVPAWRDSPPLGADGRLLMIAAGGAAVLIAVAGAGLAAYAWRTGRRGPATELALLTACALLAPPVVTIAVYLAAWHSPRHLALLRRDAAYARRPLLPLCLAAAAATAGAVVALVVLVRLAGDAGLASVLREQIWLVTALTVPHGLVVAWLDRTRVSRLS